MAQLEISPAPQVSGEAVTIMGTGFVPGVPIALVRDGALLTDAPVSDASGAFVLDSVAPGAGPHTLTATPILSASLSFTVVVPPPPPPVPPTVLLVTSDA